jgi:glutathione synthase/RimK-type ligase-like ATP-grasp enzyme
MSTALIIGRHDDPHTQAVSSALTDLGSRAICIDTYRSDLISIGLPPENGVAAVRLKNELRALDAAQISSVWLRQKPFVPMPWWSPLEHDAAQFTQAEWRNLIQTLENFLPHANWVNPAESQRKANYKPNQLWIADRIGFRDPRTEITNDPDVVLGMIGSYEKIIYKNFSGFLFSDQTGILTSVITRETLEENLESVCRAPGIYQEFLPKKYEARVTSMDSDHFCARIRTPEEGPASIDWRYAQFEDIFEPGELPEKIRCHIERYLKETGLRYGAFDFVVTPDNDWYFLECNPAGQFLWIENALGYPIARTLAETLIDKSDRLT